MYFSFYFKCIYLGIVPRIWNPIFEVMKQRVERCAIGYIEVIENAMYDTDAAMIANNSSYLLLAFKVYALCYQMLLPIIHDPKIHQNLVESLEGGKPLLESLSNGYIDWCQINQIIYKSANDLNNCF